MLGDSLTHFGTISSSRILDDGKKYWEMFYDNSFDEEKIDATELSTCQDLYNAPFFLSFWQLIIIFQLPVSDDIVDSDEEGVRSTIGDIGTLEKLSLDNSEADGFVSLASILDKINKDGSIFGSKTKRIKMETYNNSRYESTKISLAYRFMQSLHLNPTLKPLTTMVDDPNEPTNQIEEFYVK